MEKITQAELKELFGETLPIDAVRLLTEPLGDMTIDDVRDKLKEIAARKSKPMKVTIIAAVAANGVIGNSADNSIPWHIPADFKHFKETTKDGVVIMGRNTWESLPKRPLPNRENIVIYNPTKGFPSNEEHYGCNDLTIALEQLCRDHLNAERVYIIGGARLYEEGLSIADELVITHIDEAYEGDVYFPRIDRAIWEETQTKTLAPGVVVGYYKRR